MVSFSVFSLSVALGSEHDCDDYADLGEQEGDAKGQHGACEAVDAGLECVETRVECVETGGDGGVVGRVHGGVIIAAGL